MRFDQGELAFSGEDHPWLRREKEPARAYSAFAIYRDLGPRRTLIESVREYRAQNGLIGRAEKQSHTGAPSAWRKWRGDWAWDERIQAYDRYRADAEAKADAEAEEVRLKAKAARRKEHDDQRYARLLRIASRLDALLNTNLAKTRGVQKTVDGVHIEERDAVKEFVALAEEEHRIAEEYFGESAGPGLSAPEIPLIGEFRYVPDPEMFPEDVSDIASSSGGSGERLVRPATT